MVTDLKYYEASMKSIEDCCSGDKRSYFYYCENTLNNRIVKTAF